MMWQSWEETKEFLFSFHSLTNFLFPSPLRGGWIACFWAPGMAKERKYQKKKKKKVPNYNSCGEHLTWKYKYLNIAVVLSKLFQSFPPQSTPPSLSLTRKETLTKELFIVVSVVQAAKYPSASANYKLWDIKFD